jgi:hypothetical protein
MTSHLRSPADAIALYGGFGCSAPANPGAAAQYSSPNGSLVGFPPGGVWVHASIGRARKLLELVGVGSL